MVAGSGRPAWPAGHARTRGGEQRTRGCAAGRVLPPAGPALFSGEGGCSGRAPGPGQAARPRGRQRQQRRRWQPGQGKSRSSSFLSCHGRGPRDMMFGNKGGCGKPFAASSPFRRGRGVPPWCPPPGSRRRSPAVRIAERRREAGVLPCHNSTIDFTGGAAGQDALGEAHQCGGCNPTETKLLKAKRGWRLPAGTEPARRDGGAHPARSGRAGPHPRHPVLRRHPCSRACSTRRSPIGSAIAVRNRRNWRNFSPWRGLLHPVPLVQAPPP